MITPLTVSPAPLIDWLPLWQATGFFLATFVLEDVAAVGAGLLLASGHITWTAAFTACFLGIWLGDAGLYALARFAGRQWFERSTLYRFSPRVEVSEKWFKQRGTAILVLSRLIPGARLPTYLAAGFLRVPAGRFMLITGIAAFGWTFMVLLFTQKFGSQVANWLMHFKVSGLALVCSGLGAIYLINRVRGAARKHDLVGKAMSNIERWRHWEFWPAWLFYPPVVFYCGWLALKYRGLTVPTAANPGIFSGGMVGESKMATLRELSLTSGEFTAAAKLVGGDTFTTRVLSFNEIRAQLDLDFPLILKPDIGQRGAGVKLIRSEDQAHAYFRQTDAPLIVQRYASGPNEVGIFYYRFPNETKGHIFKITVKNFPKITGDGVSKLSELIDCDSRAGLISKTYRQRFADRLGDVLKVGQELKLVEAGNHAQGCIFLDGEYLRTPELEARIDSISANLTGFFIGRYDIRYETEDDLRAGRKFQIIELNGAAAEATSIYDARNSLLEAYRTLFQQWDLVFAIGAANRKNGCIPTRLSVLWKTWREYDRLATTYPSAD